TILDKWSAIIFDDSFEKHHVQPCSFSTDSINGTMMRKNYRQTIFKGLFLILCITGQNISSKSQDAAWFPFQQQDYYKTENLDLGHWVDAVAEKHGSVEMHGKDLVIENGRQNKFEGTNNNGNKSFTSPEKALDWVQSLAEYGINGVRFHK